MYIKSIIGFLNDVERRFEGAVIDVLKTPSTEQAEIDSWRESLPSLAVILNQLPLSVKNNCEIVLEARFGTEDNRADVVLVGKNDNDYSVVIIENKRWSDLERYSPAGDNCIYDPCHNNQMISHPSQQVMHYKKTLEYTNKFVQENNVSVSTMVYMQNGEKPEKEANSGPFDHRFDDLTALSPIYTGDECNEIIEFLKAKLNNGEYGLAERIYSSKIHYSSEFCSILSNVFGNREELINILDEDQVALFDEILNAVTNTDTDEKKVFIIEGAPGTGKTFVAMALLSYLYQDLNPNYMIKYVEKNRAPRIALINELNVPCHAIECSIKDMDANYDCLICDESHRMIDVVYRRKDERNFIKRFLEISRISVFFYDKNQRVHVDDYVTKERIIDDSGISLDNIIERRLNNQHRCCSAERFLNFINCLLDSVEGNTPIPATCNFTKLSENDDYKVALVNDPEILFRIIRERNRRHVNNHSSRVLAGKGRSYGRDWEWHREAGDDYPTIAPLRNDPTRLYTWNLNNYAPGTSFATDERSVDLVGCIDTCQGLDFDYIGVIISPDLIYDPDTQKIEACIEGHQSADPNTGKNNVERYGADLIKEIIINTYRVLLSRGENGCYIYCCDQNLHDYLSQFIDVLSVDNSDITEEENQTHDSCPNCGGDLVLRHGAYGHFYGCSNFPNCRYTKSIH